MTERKKKLLSLLVSTSIFFSLTSCGTNTNSIKRQYNDKKEIIYRGKISYIKLKNVYIVEIEKLDGTKELYLTYESIIGVDFNVYKTYELLGTYIEITNSNEYKSSYGKVINVIPFEQFVSTYSDIKEIYTGEDLISIFDNVKKDYDELIKNKTVKKLELKK